MIQIMALSSGTYGPITGEINSNQWRYQMSFSQCYKLAEAAGLLPAYLQLVSEGFAPGQALVILREVTP